MQEGVPAHLCWDSRHFSPQVPFGLPGLKSFQPAGTLGTGTFKMTGTGDPFYPSPEDWYSDDYVLLSRIVTVTVSGGCRMAQTRMSVVRTLYSLCGFKGKRFIVHGL